MMTPELRRGAVLEATEHRQPHSVPDAAIWLSSVVAPRRRPLSGTPRAIVNTERPWHLNLSDLVCLNDQYPCVQLLLIKIHISTCRIYATLEPHSKWCLHWPAGPRRSLGEAIEHHQIGPHTDDHRPVLHQSGTNP